MKDINYKYYKNDNNYNCKIYEEYIEDIINYIRNFNIKEYYKILEKDKRTVIYNIFCETRSNIIRWYNFGKKSKVLEIGGNYGELTGTLADRCHSLTTVEFSKHKVEAIYERYKDKENIEIICGNLKDIEFKEKYDYITLIGIVEYYKELGFKTFTELINYVKKYLNKDGKILIALDNKFGAKYLVGAKKYKDDCYFSNFQIEDDKINLYGKGELKDFLNETYFAKIKFFYPLPDYKMTHLIYSDDYIPKLNSNKSLYNLYYDDSDEILANELDIIKNAIKNNKFDFFSNSFFIELTNGEEERTKFVNYNNIRKNEFKIITKIKENNVEKINYSNKSKQHIENIAKNLEILRQTGFNLCEKYNNDKIISEFLLADTLDVYLNKLIMNNQIQKFYEEVDNFFDYIKNKLIKEKSNAKTIFEKYNININDEMSKRLTYIKNGFWDLIFQNVFYVKEKYIIFDQEWYEENIPLEFIYYRSIRQLFFLNNDIKDRINYYDLLKKYKLEEYIKIFDELEKKLIYNIDEKYMAEFYKMKSEKILSVEEIKERYKLELSEIYKKHDNLYFELQKIKSEYDIIINKKMKLEKNKICKMINKIKKKLF